MLSIAWLVAAAAVADSTDCSKFEWFGRAPDRVYFLGIALGDTVRTGRGAVEPSGLFGHFGRGRERRVFGQRIAVTRPGADWANNLPAGVTEAVLVPWDYAPDCSPVFWERSSAWVPSGTTGLFSGSVRPEDQWVDGIPTLDVFSPEFVPYIQGDPVIRELTPEDLLSLVDALPTAEEFQRDPLRSLSRMERWVEVHSHLADLAPADGIVSRSRYSASWTLVRESRSPVAGTYRVVIERPSGARVDLVVSTEARPWNTLNSRRLDGAPSRGLFGAYLAASVIHADGEIGWGTQLAVSVDSTVGERGAEWIGDFPSIRLAVRYAPDARTKSAFSELYDETARVTDGDYFPGVWRRAPDGTVSFDMRIVDGTELLYRVIAVKVSERTVERR